MGKIVPESRKFAAARVQLFGKKCNILCILGKNSLRGLIFFAIFGPG
jgi:hypothetical protein